MPKALNVAAYARVSSAKDAMRHSLSAQVSHYSNYIQSHPRWNYAGVYADEAKTGTKDSRENFQRLLADCRAGKIDLVITKSISRFARNTVTLLETVRELKSLGIDIYFEEQNIHTLSSEGELMLSILASFAQAESLSASENQKWRIKKNFEEGQVWNSTMLGYRTENGKLIIVPDEARIVKHIFSDYLSGKGIVAIANALNDDGISTRNGCTWHNSAVHRILRNYNYTGNLILQKTYRENHITKKTLVNNGELPKYHATETHEPIIDLAIFEEVQEEILRRALLHAPKKNTAGRYPFSGKIICGKCGKNYRRKTTKSGIVWICSTYNSKGKAACASKQIPEGRLTEVLGDMPFDTITADDGNKLTVRFGNSETVLYWKDRSRSESWTDEMKAQARQKTLERSGKMGSVTVIPATKQKYDKLPLNERKRRKVAGYARVSTGSEEQLTSHEAQVDYYTRYIRSNADWEFAGVYTDEGISALNTKNRDGFKRMIEDALAGKIDLIITKSVSRFARNTVDSLSTIRKFKEDGIEVYFEKESIWSFDGKGKLLLTIMSSLAQEESRSISDNVTWGQRKRFADGKVSMAFGQFLGYRKGDDGEPEIVLEEAEIVRSIYKMFIDGKTANFIAKKLTKKGIPTPGGKEVWQSTTIESILTNEKYKGDAILQKKFTVDFLNKKMKVNEGEVPQYYVTDSHPAIIDKQEWDLVQAEMAKRKGRGKHHNSLSPFSAKIVCGDCGGYFGSKVWYSTDKYRRVIWRCNGKYKGVAKCDTPHLTEDEIKEMFLKAMAELLLDRNALLEDCQLMRDTLADTSKLDDECKSLTDEMDSISVLIQKLIDENATVAMSQDEYNEKYDGYAERYNQAKERYDNLQQRKTTLSFEVDIIECFMFEIKALPGLPMEFSDSLWNAMIDKVTVHADGRAVFTFKNGREIIEIID